MQKQTADQEKMDGGASIIDESRWKNKEIGRLIWKCLKICRLLIWLISGGERMWGGMQSILQFLE